MKEIYYPFQKLFYLFARTGQAKVLIIQDEKESRHGLIVGGKGRDYKTAKRDKQWECGFGTTIFFNYEACYSLELISFGDIPYNTLDFVQSVSFGDKYIGVASKHSALLSYNLISI